MDMNVKYYFHLNKEEIDALIDYHHARQHEAARKEEYNEAAEHKQRAELWLKHKAADLKVVEEII